MGLSFSDEFMGSGCYYVTPPASPFASLTGTLPAVVCVDITQVCQLGYICGKNASSIVRKTVLSEIQAQSEEFKRDIFTNT